MAVAAWWRLDETSGTRADRVGTATLTDNNTVGSATGLVSALAADFVAAQAESLSTTDAVLVGLLTLALPWSLVLWIRPETPIESTLSEPVSTYNSSKGIQCRRRGFSAFGSSTIAWDIVNNAGTAFRIEGTANTPKDAWSMIALMYNGSGLAWCRTNASTSSTVAVSGTLTPYSTFRLGARALPTGADYWDGRIGPAGVYSHALSGAELDALYNGGAGFDPTASAGSQGGIFDSGIFGRIAA